MSQDNWITCDLLEQILKQENGFRRKDIRVLSCKVEPAMKKGDGYASEMFRVVIEYEESGNKISVIRILKVMPSGEIQRKIMDQNRMYPREIAIYRDIIPRLNKLLRSIGDQTLIAPNCTLTTNDPKLMLVFEDIKAMGYQMVDRRFGLDLKHSKLVIAKLAKLHACSAIIYKENPALMDPVIEGSITTNPKRQDFLGFYKMCSRQVITLVESWKDPEYSELLTRLRKLPDIIIPKGCQLYTRDDAVFNVLNHDDIWTNNMMFKYQDGSVEDVLIFDYQLAYFGSPGIDLNFFLYSSVQDEIRENHFLELVRNYHNVLKSTLQKLQYPGMIPPIEDIHVEIIRQGFRGLFAVISLLPMAMMERSEHAEMDVFLQESEVGEAFRRQIFSNPRLEPVLKRALVRFDQLGYFD